ncbi:Ankyrin repeat-containing protein [Entamoeba marina]
MATPSIDLFQRLFICDEGYDLLIQMSRFISSDSLQFIQHTMNFYEAHKQTLHFLEHLIHYEVTHCENGTMFRGNSFCTRCLTTHTLMTDANNYSTIIDVSVENLKEIVGEFISAIVDSIELWPESYRYICYVLYNECEKQENLQPLPCVGGFLILRIVCPALMQPHKTGFCTEKPNQNVTRSLVMICKLIQCIANGTTPHEPYMKCLEEFIDTQTLRLQIALTGVSSTRPTKIGFVSVKSKTLENSMNGIINVWKNNIKVVDSYLQTNATDEFKKLARAVVKLSTKSFFKRKSIMKKKHKEDIAIANLFEATKQGNIKDVTSIIKKYPEIIDCTDVDMMTPLHYACVTNNSEIALFLLLKGASMYLEDAMGFKALHYSCLYNLPTILEFYKTINFGEVGALTEEGNTCLHYLAKHNFDNFHVDFLQYLISKDDAILNTVNYAGDSPLHVAVTTALSNGSNETRTILTLIKYGANLHIKNRNNKTPISIVQEVGRTDLELLMMSEEVVKTSPISNSAVTRIKINELSDRKRKRRSSILIKRFSTSPRSLAAYQSRASISRSSTNPLTESCIK